MTSAELKHRAKLQEWAARIQDCRSSGLSVRAWCRQEEINAATYYRWERELLALAETEPCSSVSAVRFAELPAPKRVSRNVAERSATLHIGNASLDIYPGCDTEQLKMLVELLRLWWIPSWIRSKRRAVSVFVSPRHSGRRLPHSVKTELTFFQHISAGKDSAFPLRAYGRNAQSRSGHKNAVDLQFARWTDHSTATSISLFA